MLTFGFATMISVKILKANNVISVVSLTLKTVIFVLVQIQKVIFCETQKALTFLRLIDNPI